MKTIRERDNENNLEALIASNGYSKAQFADLIGVSRQYLHKVINNEIKMKTETMIKASELLNVELEELFNKKCLICNRNLQTIDYNVDRLGNSTLDRKSSDNIHKIYDCQSCGYIQLTEKFVEDFDFIHLATDKEYTIIEKVMNIIREDYHVKWYEIISITLLGEPNYMQVELLLTSKTTKTTLIIYYDDQNEEIYKHDLDEDFNFDPVNYSYEVTIIKNEAYDKENKGLELYLFSSKNSSDVVTRGFYLGEGTGMQRNNIMKVIKGTKIPFDDNLTKSVSRKKDALRRFSYHIEDGYYVLDQDADFTSPSLAAAIVLGKECSGTRLWKNKDGKDLYSIQNKDDNHEKRNRNDYRKANSTHENKVINKTNLESIIDVLSEKHNMYYNAKEIPFDFSKNNEADALIKDLENNPEAFLIGCLMDRGIKAETAWEIPLRLKQIIGSIKMDVLVKLTYEEIEEIYVENNIHRYKTVMAKVLYEGLKLVNSKYKGDPTKIWTGTKSSKIVVDRFNEFHGVGKKISTMAVNILYRDFKLPYEDLSGIDISPDSQVMKVFKRLGIIEGDKDTYEVIKKAREMNPDFPGIFDISTWEIGREYCHATNPDCINCPLNDYCKKNL